MYAGKVAEKGSVYDVFDRPSHPYTKGLLESIPRLDTPPKSRLTIIPGMVPGLLDMPGGCRFENRCRYRKDGCLVAPPAAEIIAPGHQVACLEWRELRVNAPAGGGDSASFKRCALGSAMA
jgi:peptide/nickel transport system ATP-binding protein